MLNCLWRVWLISLITASSAVVGCRPAQTDPKNGSVEEPEGENVRKNAPELGPAAELAPMPRTPKRLVELAEKMARAQAGCKIIADAIDAYITHPNNVENLPPIGLDLLFEPLAFGGGPILRDQQVLFDPWENRYVVDLFTKADKTTGFLLNTKAPDGTPISQFGIGEAARPKE